MIDHLLSFADEAAAQAALPGYWTPPSNNEPGAWRGDVCLPGLSVYKVTGTETITPPAGWGDPYEQEIREPYPGWFLMIALPELSAELRDLPDNGCMLIADRDAAARGETDFIGYLSPNFNPADLPITRAEPVFTGADYPFHAATL